MTVKEVERLFRKERRINMKIIKESKIEERFNKPSDRTQHYVDHVVPSGFSNRKNPWGKNDYEFPPYDMYSSILLLLINNT